MHLFKKEIRLTEIHPNKTFLIRFDLFFEKLDYEPLLIDPPYQLHPYWDDDFQDQAVLEFELKFSSSLQQIEDDDIITYWHESDKLRYESTDSPLSNLLPTHNFKRCLACSLTQKSTHNFNLFEVKIRNYSHYRQVSKSEQRKVLSFPIDSWKLTIDSLIDRSALTGAT